MRKNKWLLGVTLPISMVALAACSGTDEKPATEETSAAAEKSPDAAAQGAKPNTDDIPEIVAKVNGDTITKADFVPLYETQYQQMQLQAQQSGQPVDEKQLKKQTAENLVSTKVLTQEADKRNIAVTDKDVEKALSESAKSSQMSTEDFLSAMKKQGMDEAKVNSELKSQLKIEQLVDDEYGEFKASDEEIGQAYEQAKMQQEQMGQQGGQPAQVPELEEMRPQLEEQVKSQKANEATQEYAGKLRKKADVTINL